MMMTKGAYYCRIAHEDLGVTSLGFAFTMQL